MDKPIIFSAPMVQALLAGRKTQTRRLLKKPAAIDALAVFGPKFLTLPGNVDLVGYAPGARLYVREAFWSCPTALTESGWDVHAYRADDDGPARGRKLRPSIHMPRWASRLTLTVTEVRVQRLQEISEADAVAEGVERLNGAGPNRFSVWLGDGWFNDPSAQECYARLWRNIHGPDAWDANPWVAAISFTVQHGNIDAVADGREWNDMPGALT
jgi:hypothetical protein